MTTRRRRLASIAIMATVLATAACASDETTGPGALATTPATDVVSSTADSEALRVARAFTAALNRGDSAAARACFSPSGRFDSVGRIYPDRNAIFDRFLDPEVIAVGGRYAERSTRTEGDRLVVAYTFTTRSGGREDFTYAYQIRDGLITDVIGRYV
jgi:hypothetical protein